MWLRRSWPCIRAMPRHAAYWIAVLARIESAQGAVVMRVSLDDGVRPGDVFAPMHWTDQFTSSGPVDRLVHALTDPVSGQPDLKGTPVRVSAVAGILARQPVPPGQRQSAEFSRSIRLVGPRPRPAARVSVSNYRASSPLAGEIHAETVLRRLLHIPAEAELVTYSDARKGMFRYAGIAHGRLVGCAFFGPPGSDFPGLEQAKGATRQRNIDARPHCPSGGAGSVGHQKHRQNGLRLFLGQRRQDLRRHPR